MIIEYRFKVEHCCARDDSGRPTLTHVQIGKFGDMDVAVAADGYMMAIVPVEMNENDVPGMVHRDVFRRVRRHSGATLESDSVLFENGWRAPRIKRLENGEELKDYPDFTRTVNQARDVQPVSPHLSVDLRLLRKIQKAIGANRSGVVMSRSRHDGPLLISPSHAASPFVPPFGILMPLHTAGWAGAPA